MIYCCSVSMQRFFFVVVGLVMLGPETDDEQRTFTRNVEN